MACNHTGPCGLGCESYQAPPLEKNYGDFFPRGWECPKCKRIYAPSHNECEWCNHGMFDLTKVGWPYPKGPTALTITISGGSEK